MKTLGVLLVLACIACVIAVFATLIGTSLFPERLAGAFAASLVTSALTYGLGALFSDDDA